MGGVNEGSAIKGRATTRALGYAGALLAVLALVGSIAYLVLLTGAEQGAGEARETATLAENCLAHLEGLEASLIDVEGVRIETIDEGLVSERCRRLLSADPSSTAGDAQIDAGLLLEEALHKELAVNRLNGIATLRAFQAAGEQTLVMRYVRGGTLVVLLLAVICSIWFFRRQARVEAEEFELESARILHGQAESPHYDKLVAINVKHLDAYYLLVKGQTGNSFFVTLAVAVAGFAFITAGLVVAFTSASAESTILADSRFVWIATGSGVIVEFVAAVFFYLYNRTVHQLRQYHESLIGVQNTLLAFKMVEQVSPETDQNKAAIIQQVVNYLLGEKQKAPQRAE